MSRHLTIKESLFHKLASGRRFRKFIGIIAIAAILKPYTFSYGDTSGTFKLMNGTHLYIDAKINEKSFLFIPPGTSLLYEFNAPATIYLDVSYCPGQPIKGGTTRTFTVEYQYRYDNTNTSSYNAHDCSNANDCSTNSKETASGSVTTWVNPVFWTVREDSMSTGGGVIP